MRRFSYCQMLQVSEMFSFRFGKKEKSNIKDGNIQFASSEVTYLHSKRRYSYVTNKRCDYIFIPNDKRVILSRNQLYRHTWIRWTIQVKWCKAALCAQTQSGGVTPECAMQRGYYWLRESNFTPAFSCQSKLTLTASHAPKLKQQACFFSFSFFHIAKIKQTQTLDSED